MEVVFLVQDDIWCVPVFGLISCSYCVFCHNDTFPVFGLAYIWMIFLMIFVWYLVCFLYLGWLIFGWYLVCFLYLGLYRVHIVFLSHNDTFSVFGLAYIWMIFWMIFGWYLVCFLYLGWLIFGWYFWIYLADIWMIFGVFSVFGLADIWMIFWMIFGVFPVFGLILLYVFFYIVFWFIMMCFLYSGWLIFWWY